MGFLDSIGKFFKKVTSSTIGKIVFGALGVAAVVFTGGAALGLGGIFAGGFGGAIATLAGNLGLSGTLGGIFTGALTQAGYGAVLGGAIAGLTGGDILEGAAGGGLTGLVTGGVMGGLGMGTDPLKGVFGGPEAAPPPTSGPAAPTPAPAPATSPPPSSPLAAPEAFKGLPSTPANIATKVVPGTPAVTPPASPDVAGFTAAGQAAATTPAAAVTPTQTGFAGWIGRNQDIVGRAVLGLGQGLLGGDDDQTGYLRERDAMTRASYDLPGDDYTKPRTTFPTGAQKYAPDWRARLEERRRRPIRYRYNPDRKMIEPTEV